LLSPGRMTATHSGPARPMPVRAMAAPRRRCTSRITSGAKARPAAPDPRCAAGVRGPRTASPASRERSPGRSPRTGWRPPWRTGPAGAARRRHRVGRQQLGRVLDVVGPRPGRPELRQHQHGQKQTCSHGMTLHGLLGDFQQQSCERRSAAEGTSLPASSTVSIDGGCWDEK